MLALTGDDLRISNERSILAGMAPAHHPAGLSEVAGLAEVGRAVRPLTLAADRLVPVLPGLSGVVPGGGLARGSVTHVDGPAATSLALALLAGPSAAGSWVTVVGCPDLGLAAAAEAGLVLERVALVAEPAPGDWAAVVAALLGGVDVVLVGPTHRVGAADARRLAARARERGTVLVQLRPPRRSGRSVGLEADLRLTVIDASWQGVGRGHGHVQARRLTVDVGGRRWADRPRQVELWCPGPTGAVVTVASEPAAPREQADERWAGSDTDQLVEHWRDEQVG
jgi:hypothetical protein